MSYSFSINDSRPVVFYKDEVIKPLNKENIDNKRALFGQNVIENHSSRAWYKILLSAILDPFNLLLFFIALLSLYLNETKTFFIMAIMVSVSTSTRTYQELKNENKTLALTKMIKKQITVIRLDSDDNEYEEIIDLRDCVPGDFVKLKAGDLVPAEVQLIKTNNLSVDQSCLTGEETPQMKYCTDFEEIRIFFDIDATNSINLKKTSFLQSFKKVFFSFLRNNFGIDLKHNDDKKIEFDTNVMAEFDKNDLCFMGTSVISGSALGVIVAIGSKTYFGVMSEKISFSKPITAFSKSIKRVSGLFILMMISICVPIIIFKGYFKKQEENQDEDYNGWVLTIQFSLSICIGLCPEMLPAIINVILAKGTINLSNKNCIVKRIESIINLGNMNILCTDKTGTLTENFATLTNVFDFKKMNCPIGLELAYLNSAYQESSHNLTDEAIISAYEKIIGKNEDDLINLDQSAGFVKINEIPFDYQRRKMTLVYEIADLNLRLLTSKGAVKEMLECSSFCIDIDEQNNNEVKDLESLFKILKLTNDENEVKEFIDKNNSKFNFTIKKLTKDILDGLYEFNSLLNQNGNRVLAVCYQVESMDVDRLKSKLVEKNLIFVGFLILSNPPKESVKSAIKSLNLNNVSVKILTGDTVEICKNICRQINLNSDHVITSKRMKTLIKSELEELVEKTVIFSQLSPIQKLDIVKMLKDKGNVVGFLGDGVNDGLALKEADVGISVHSATEIAKEAADIILLEKDLDVINDGVIDGRCAYINIIKYISMVISSNFGNVLSIFVSLFWLPFLPMAPIHLLLQNLFYDLSQMTLPFDNVDYEDIRFPEQFKLKNLIYFMLFWGPVSSIFDIATFAYFYFYYSIKTNNDNVLMFQTGWFCVGILTQTLVVHILRTHRIPIFQSNASFKVYLSTTLCLIVGIALPFLPFLHFKMVKLPLNYYYFLGIVLISYCLLCNLLKSIYIFMFKSWFVNIN